MNASDTAKVHYDAGVAACEEKQFSVAVQEFGEAIRINPHYPPALRDLGWMSYGMFSQVQEALSYLQKAKELDEFLEDVDMYLGIVLARLERFAEAERSIAISRTSDFGLAHAVFADYLSTRGRSEEAEDHFKKAISLTPNLVLAFRDYARLLSSEGRDDDADRLFRQALELDPSNATTARYYRKFSARRRREQRKNERKKSLRRLTHFLGVEDARSD